MMETFSREKWVIFIIALSITAFPFGFEDYIYFGLEDYTNLFCYKFNKNKS